MRFRNAIQVLILLMVFCTSILVLASSSTSCDTRKDVLPELLEDGDAQSKETKLIWEGLPGQFFSSF